MEQFADVAGFVARSAWGILPVFLLSVSLGVLVRALKLDGVVRRAFASRVALSVVFATAVGAFSPFCSCTVIPIVAGLLIGGVPLAPVMAFWVASPTMDPEIFAFSAAALGIPVALARLIGALALSVGAGLLVLAVERRGGLRTVLRSSRDAVADPAPTCGATESRPSCSTQPVAAAAPSAAPIGVTSGAGSSGATLSGAVQVDAGGAAGPGSSSCSTGPEVDDRPLGTILLADLRQLRLGQFLRDMWSDAKGLLPG